MAGPASVNSRAWSRGNFVRLYAGRELRPPEAEILARYRDELGGRVLELGAGAGRISGHLLALGAELHGIDVSPRMVEFARERYPDGTFEVHDLRDLGSFPDGSRDGVVAAFNVLDILDDDERRRILGELARIVRPGGLLVMSTHNLAYAPRIRPPTRLRGAGFVRGLARLVRLPRRVRNHRRARPLERRAPGYAILNDEAHEYRFLHYYIGRDAQERQLAEHGFELLECLDLDGRRVAPGEDAAAHAELHYVARRFT